MIRKLSLTLAALAALGAAMVCLGSGTTLSVDLSARSGYIVASS